MDPDDGPAPPPFRSGSPRTATKSFPEVVGTISNDDGRAAGAVGGGCADRDRVKGETGKVENASSAARGSFTLPPAKEEIGFGTL